MVGRNGRSSRAPPNHAVPERYSCNAVAKTPDPDAYDTWFRAKVQEALDDMLLSFPTDVSTEKVRDIALDWAEHFFESGSYGDQWDYVLAVHDDRAHRHAHIVLNNRGRENGTWFSCWAEGVMSPQLMREKQAEIAETYGVILDATTRLERGIFVKLAKAVHPIPDRLMRYRDAAFRQKILDVAQAQREPMVGQNGVANGAAWKSEAVDPGRIFGVQHDGELPCCFASAT